MERLSIPIEGGKTCRYCKKWDGVKCADMRLKHNDDLNKPCLLYKHRNAPAVDTRDPKAKETKVCPRCGKRKPLWAFDVGRKKDIGTCAECRERIGDLRFNENRRKV